MQIYYEKSDIVAKWKAPNVHPVHLQKKRRHANAEKTSSTS